MKRIKIVSIIISIMLMVLALPMGITATAATSSWDGTTIAQPTSMKTIDGVYYYEISTAEELAYIAKTGGDWLGYNYILANDITLNSVELTYDVNGNLTANASTLNQWTPINGFTGIFDGAGRSISGIYVNTTSSAGFFTNNQGILKNLTIKNSYIKGSSSVGGICGSFTKTGAEFSNCIFYGAVVGSYNVGGLIGTNDCSNIENCINYGNVFGESNVGGIVGKFEAYGIDNSKNYGKITATGNSVGGIAGNAYYPISGCVNYADVTGNDYVGGIFGNIFWGSDVTNCGNTGKITGHNYVGGLIGDNAGLWNDTTISNSYNTGDVIGNSKVGGLAGNISYGGVYNSYNVGNVNGTELVGAIIGYSGTVWGQGTVSNCYYLKTNTINNTIKGFGNSGDVENVVRDKKVGFFPIVADPSADPSYSKLGYKNGEVDDPIDSNIPDVVEPDKELVWDGSTLQPSVMITDNGVNYYKIFTGKELAYIAKTGGDWLSYNYILANDVILNSVELTYDNNGDLTIDASTLNQWTPINGFKGIFNGNGFTVSGVYVNTTSSAGFFTNNQGILKNLTIKNSYIKGSSSVGGICGSFTKTGAEFSNCTFYGAVVGSYNVGGLIGTNDCSNIENCINYGNVFGESNVGGIVGKFEAYGIDNSKNYGKIIATGNSVGGIAGNAYYPISGCVNYGDVSGNDYVGGIFGNIFWGSDVTNCGNVAKITGNNYVGGLIGDNTGLWNDTTISNSYNTGEVIGNSKVGGLAGNISYGGVYNSYNVGNVSGTESVGAVVGYSDTIWGKGTASNCVYMKTETINATLKGFGNADDVAGVVNAKNTSFFCLNSDKTLNKNGHTYSSTVPCDATCDNCGYERKVTHTYDNIKYDSDKHWYECDCGEVKPDSVETHIGGAATCTNKAKCDVCKEAYGDLNANNHTAATNWTSTNGQHYHTCTNGCDAKLDIADCSGGRATCQEKATCAICKRTYGAFAEHNFDETSWGYKNADGHAHACQTSGCSEHDTVVAHTSSGAATEDVAETCTECGYIISPTLGHKKHTAKTEWTTDDKHHWHECTGCEGQQLDKSSHKDLDNNAKCDTCGATVPVGTTGESDNANTESPDGSDQNNTGMDSGKTNGCGGVIGGASAVVITLAGLGAFFIFKKKKAK